MSNELRLRQNAIGGLVEDNPLSNSATTLTSAGLAALTAVTSTGHMVVVLDPDGRHGAPEIAYVTAHTASATSATISRGKEGTTAREHPRDTYWIHGPVISDYPVAAYKPADESVTNSSTLQDDDHLFFPVTANSAWQWQAHLFHIGTPTGDIQFAWTVPSGSTVIYGGHSVFTDGAAYHARYETASGTGISYGASNSTPLTVVMFGTVEVSSTPGDVQLQWAQASANATTTTLKRGSNLLAHRMA